MTLCCCIADLFLSVFNRQEFVCLYAEYTLNTSVERQFRAFKTGERKSVV